MTGRHLGMDFGAGDLRVAMARTGGYCALTAGSAERTATAP
jgi:hypothetical protein